MKELIKGIYLIVFFIRYKVASFFIREKPNTILFISEFSYTLDAIKNKYPANSFNKLEFNPKKERLGKQIKYMCKAKYIYTDNYNVLMPYISKKKVKIQSWHAPVAVKKIGFLSNEVKSKGKLAHKRYQKVYNAYDYYICPSKHMANVFKESFNIPEGKILNYGYLKLDYYLSKDYQNKVLHYEKDYDILLDKLNIVYIPTFRNSQADNKKQVAFINQLVDSFSEEYNIWYKLHNQVKVDEKNCKGKKIYEKDLEPLLQFADIVITDYSSIYIEALMNKCALIYYLYDIDKYTKKRGLNLNVENLPGDKAYDFEQVKAIIDSKTYKKLSIQDLEEEYIPFNLKQKNSEASIKIIKKLHG